MQHLVFSVEVAFTCGLERSRATAATSHTTATTAAVIGVEPTSINGTIRGPFTRHRIAVQARMVRATRGAASWTAAAAATRARGSG